MSYATDIEHDQLRAVVREFLADRSPEAAVRKAMETDLGFDRDLWTALATQLGLQGLAVPEAFGGSGAGTVELQIVCEEMGRSLVCAPFLSTAVLATSALLASSDDAACARYLPAIADGSIVVTLAVTEESGSWAAHDVTTTAVPTSDGFRLHGEKVFVIDGHAADLLIVVARTAMGPSLFAVTAGAAGSVSTPLTTLDPTRRQARIRFDGTPATLVGREGNGARPVERALDRGMAALAAEQTGGARRVLEMSVEYAKVRKQFGRPIGMNQAIKHKCADMLLAVECSASAAGAAGRAVDEEAAEAQLLCSVAKAYCSEAFTWCARENIQVHGGIGFTWEHPAHLFLKRAKSDEILFGSPRHHRAQMTRRIAV
jgi:alkylation response protein AidB-like acyl-CoA dehydrogenase